MNRSFLYFPPPPVAEAEQQLRDPVEGGEVVCDSPAEPVQIEYLSEIDPDSLRAGLIYPGIKRGFDLITAIGAGIVLLPFLLLLALLIRLDSPGPALFRQRRVGAGGGPFEILKFRTMTSAPAGSAAERSHAITTDNDPRITRLGRFLRRTRMDELPQILNIIKGDMSWIGPRPEAEILSKWYEEELPFYRYRHIVKPGVTGWAQVNQGHVCHVDEVMGKLQYDLHYIRNISPRLDILILLKTVNTVITGHGSR